MDQASKNKINENLPLLISDMDGDFVAHDLLSQLLFNERIVNDIKAQSTLEKRNARLIEILKTRGPTAFDLFVKALRKEQKFLAELLQPEENVVTTGAKAAPPASAAASNTLISSAEKAVLNSLTSQETNLRYQSNLKDLCEKITHHDELLNLLMEKKMIRQTTIDEIQAEPGKYKKNTKLFTHLRTRPKEEFPTFIEILRETDQNEEVIKKLIFGANS